MSDESKLQELIAGLLEEGFAPSEAVKIAASTLRMAGNSTSAIAKKQDDLSFPASPQNDGRLAVDYGNESPAEARLRWEEQERNDPQGIYSGGAESGGIFGNGPIATDTYDPAAIQRSMGMYEKQQSSQVNLEMLRTMQALQQSVRQMNESQQPPHRQLKENRWTERLLGKKKR